MMSLVVRLVTLTAMVSVALPAVAQNSAAPTTKKKPDPNEVVCEKQSVLGSRLATKKVCLTRSQWAEQRQSNHDLVARSQTSGCMPGSC
jgi:invasion protein IalB